MTKYLKNCFWLLIPILLWNLLFAAELPKYYQPEIFWKDIPQFIGTTENIFRIIIMVIPAFLVFSVETKSQHIGLWMYVIGAILYYLSWLILMYYPESNWSQSAIGFMAPAFTPILWLVGIGLVGRESFFKIKNTTLIYISLSILFTFFHCLHAFWVFQRV